MTYFYIRNSGIYFKKEENSYERYLSNLTEQITMEANLAVEAWKREYGEDKLNEDETDWLSDCVIALSYDDDSIKSEAIESGVDRELFQQLVLSALN
jgi:hypothetical protein